jgi:hypothetical protein
MRICHEKHKTDSARLAYKPAPIFVLFVAMNFGGGK